MPRSLMTNRVARGVLADSRPRESPSSSLTLCWPACRPPTSPRTPAATCGTSTKCSGSCAGLAPAGTVARATEKVTLRQLRDARP